MGQEALEKEAIGYESLDNGFLSCEKPERLAEICSRLGPIQLKHLFERWVQRLPWPLSGEDRKAGYHHELALWQLECSRTDVFERPVCGRQFFEAVIRENIDLGRPSRVQLLFDRRIQKNTPGQFRTRVITRVWPPVCMSNTSTPASNNTSRRTVPCGPKPLSTMPETSQ